MQSIKVIFTRLFRIFAIVYYHHFTALEGIGAVSHLNTSFKHFMFFVWEFDLVADAEQEALAEILKEIRLRHEAAFPHRARLGSGSSAGGGSVGGSGDGDSGRSGV